MSLLEGRRVLLVEDESLVAMLAEDMLLDLGCEVVVAMRLDKALTYVEAQAFDLAVLDVNLGDTRSYPIADVLFKRCTPFLFATGYGQRGVDTAYQAVPVVQKPYQAAQMKHLLTHLLTCEAPALKGFENSGLDCQCQNKGAFGQASSFQAETVG